MQGPLAFRTTRQLSAEQKLSLQVLESSKDQDHGDGNVECSGIGNPEEAIGDDNNVTYLNAPSVPHGVAKVMITSQVASQGT
jgi:hypothetical protein